MREGGERGEWGIHGECLKRENKTINRLLNSFNGSIHSRARVPERAEHGGKGGGGAWTWG